LSLVLRSALVTRSHGRDGRGRNRNRRWFLLLGLPAKNFEVQHKIEYRTGTIDRVIKVATPPVMITVAATVLALFPLALHGGPLWQSLCYAQIGGLVPARNEPMKIIPASDSSLLIVFGNGISPELHQRVMGMFHAFLTRQNSAVRNLHPGYCSLLIDFDPLRLSHDDLVTEVERVACAEAFGGNGAANVVNIPVCYDNELGPDLMPVAEHAKMTAEEVVRLHSSASYLVYFLGFSPGFAYLGGLPDALHTPRLATPRKEVAPGSVGIAGSQTGIYPIASPGGWQLIGRTPLRMFDPGANPPTRLQPGDRVKFSPIDRATFARLSLGQ